MVAVIKYGNSSMNFICKCCGCEFTAGLNDITVFENDNVVLNSKLSAMTICPECGAKCIRLAPDIFKQEVTADEFNNSNR